MAGSLRVLSAHRFGRAKEELQTAELLLKNRNFRSSINRSYYAIFHAIRAVNALDGFDSSKHSGVIAHFNQEYVKTGMFDKGVAKIIRHASELREQADYEDFYEATQEEAAEVFEQASQFISSVGSYLQRESIL
ncbi:MAG: HEPN domain-containing protein [Candidatus Limivicinus sp.]